MEAIEEERETVTSATSGIHWRDAPVKLRAKIRKEWLSRCRRVVTDLNKNSATVARIFVLKSQFRNGHHDVEYPYLQEDSIACIRMGCCPTRGAIHPHGPDFEFFDQVMISPEDFASYTEQASAEQLGCALKTQELAITVEVHFKATRHYSLSPLPPSSKSAALMIIFWC
jgi:hypothetical protein